MRALWYEKARSYIRYLDAPGRHPAVVFLHGMGSSSIADFSRAVMERVTGGKRALLIEFLGHGFSDKPAEFGYSLVEHAETVAAVLDGAGVRGAVVVGHSMGGTVAIALTAMRPELVLKLLLLEPNFTPGVGEGSKVIAAMTEEEYVARGHRIYTGAIRRGIPASPSNAIYCGCLDVASPAAVHRSAVGLLRGTSPPQKEVLRNLAIPRFFVVGENNIESVPVTDVKEMGLERVVVEGAGHAMMHDNPAGFQAIMAELLGR